MEAFVTLTTNDGYSVGAMTLASSLKRSGTSRKLVCMVTKGVSDQMLNCLRNKFDEVVNVEELDSKDATNLKLLDRTDLGITFTKIRCWTLTKYSKCVFLDADTLALQNIDDLFDREELSAAPDAGWPDCFNSGVFVFKPSMETYSAILQHATKSGSFDGGDQGLLNTFFSSWATEDIRKHLPFTYNMVASASYSYLPAYKKFGGNVKVVHFIGATKPWLVSFDAQGEANIGSAEVHTKQHLQLWWQLFSNEVKPILCQHAATKGPAEKFPYMSGNVGTSYRSSPPPPPPPLPTDSKADWESGSPDYTGTASFNNILKKMDETLGVTKNGK